MLRSKDLAELLSPDSFGGRPGAAAGGVLVDRAGTNEQLGEALQWSAGLRFQLSMHHGDGATSMVDTPKFPALLARDESIITMVRPDDDSLYKMLRQRPEFLDALTAHGNLLIRVIGKHPGLRDIIHQQNDNDPVEVIGRFGELVAHFEGLELLAKRPNLRLRANHWRRLLGAPEFFDYLGRDRVFAAVLDVHPGLLVQLASRPLPKPGSWDSTFGVVPMEAGLDLDQIPKAVIKDHWKHLRDVVIPTLGEPVLLDDGVEVGPGEAVLVDYLQASDDKRAGEILDGIATQQVADERRAAVGHIRATISQNKAIAGLIRDKPGLARAVLKTPDLIDFLTHSTELLDLLKGPDAGVVLQTMNDSPELFATLQNHAPLYRTYVTDSDLRFNLAASADAQKAVANPDFVVLMWDQEQEQMHERLFAHSDTYRFVRQSRAWTRALIRDGVPAVEALLPAKIGVSGVDAGLGSRGLAARLSGRDEVVSAAVASSLASIKFFAQPVLNKTDPVDVVAGVPGLAAVLAERGFELAPLQYEAVLAAVERHPMQVDNIFVSLDMVKLVAAQPAVVAAMERVGGLGSLLADNAAVRGWVRMHPQVLEAVARGGQELVSALGAQPALVSFLAADSGQRVQTMSQHRFLVSAIRANRAIMSVLTSRRSTEDAANLWAVLAGHEALTTSVRPEQLRALAARPALVRWLSGHRVELSGALWREVLSNARLLRWLDSRRQGAQLLFFDPAIRDMYSGDPDLFTDALSRIPLGGSGVDHAAVVTALEAQRNARAAVSTPARPARGSAAKGSQAAGEPDKPHARHRAQPAEPDKPHARHRAQPAESVVSAADRWWVTQAGSSEELRELLATRDRLSVVRALSEEPHLLALFGARPDIVAQLIEDPERIDDYRFGVHVTSDAELADFERAFGGYVLRHDLVLDEQALSAVRGQARISWSQVRARHYAAHAEREQQRHARLAGLKDIDPQTWQMSGRILYGNGLGPDDFPAGRMTVLRTLASNAGEGGREQRVALHAALHAHLDGGDQGVTFTYLLNADAQVDIFVYAVSSGRSGNKYRWGGGAFQDGPLPIGWVEHDAAFQQSHERLAAREQIPAPAGGAPISVTAQLDQPRDPLGPLRQAVLDYYEQRHKTDTTATARSAPAGRAGQHTKNKPVSGSPPHQRQALDQAASKLHDLGLGALITPTDPGASAASFTRTALHGLPGGGVVVDGDADERVGVGSVGVEHFVGAGVVVGRGGDEVAAPKAVESTTVDSVRGWIGDMEWVSDGAVLETEAGPINCGPATMVVFDRLSGIAGAGRAHPAEWTPQDLGEATGLELARHSSEEIAQWLSAAGPQTHTVVAVRFSSGDQHSFNAYFDGEHVYALDGQRGTVEMWPPQLDRDGNRVQAWFMGIPHHGELVEGVDRRVGSGAKNPERIELTQTRPRDEGPAKWQDATHVEVSPSGGGASGREFAVSSGQDSAEFGAVARRVEGVGAPGDEVFVHERHERLAAHRSLPEPPASTPVLAAFPHSDSAIDEIRDWISDVNHDGDPDAPHPPARTVNCGPATVAVLHRLSGIPSNARANLDQFSLDDLGKATGLPFVPNTPSGIEQRLKREGRGAHTIVLVRYRGGEQHTFNAYYDGDAVYALDGQQGTTALWPPELDRRGNPVQQWAMGTPYHGDPAIFTRPDDTTEPHAELGVFPHRTVATGAGQSSSGHGKTLIRHLQAEAKRVQQARVESGRAHAVAEDRFGPDPFGFRDPPPTPPQLRGVQLHTTSTDLLGSYFRVLDLTGDSVVQLQPEPIWDFKTKTSEPGWWWPIPRPEGADPLPALPARLQMPAYIHSIWLGSTVTDGRAVTDEVRRNLEKLSGLAQKERLRVVLWTDVPRGKFAEPTGEAAAMRDWAHQHNIVLLSPDEVFHQGEPMRLAAEYKLETAKAIPAGYGAASDILRLEILYRFGGIYTDGDNAFHDLAGLSKLLGVPSFAAHQDPPAINNSALLAARGHPFISRYIEVIAGSYKLRQDELDPGAHEVGNSRVGHGAHYSGVSAFRRLSTMERAGPVKVQAVIDSFGLTGYQVPRIPSDRVGVGGAASWLGDAPRQYTSEQTAGVLQHAISGLIWDLKNRRGDLNLAAVAPLINGLADPAAGWHAVVGYIHRDPQLRMQVQTVTYTYWEFTRRRMGAITAQYVHEIELPPSVLDVLGLPSYLEAEAGPGIWRRAAFGAQVQSGNWSYLTVDFKSQQDSLADATPEMRALAEHLRNLGAKWRKVEIWIEGGGAKPGSNAGLRRAGWVQQQLASAVGRAGNIVWHQPTNRGAGPTAAPGPRIDNKRQVMLWWKATPTPLLREEFDDDAVVEFARHLEQEPGAEEAPVARPQRHGLGGDAIARSERGERSRPPLPPRGAIGGLPPQDPPVSGGQSTVTHDEQGDAAGLPVAQVLDDMRGDANQVVGSGGGSVMQSQSAVSARPLESSLRIAEPARGGPAAHQDVGEGAGADKGKGKQRATGGVVVDGDADERVGVGSVGVEHFVGAGVVVGRGGDEVAAPKAVESTTVDSVRGWIGDMEWVSDGAVLETEAGPINCGPATMVVFDRLSGIAGAGRAHPAEWTPQDLGEATGLELARHSSEEIAQWLSAAGPQTHTVVAVRFSSGDQHSFNAYFDGEHVYALDGQRGTVEMWPPQLDRDGNRVQAWFMGIPHHGELREQTDVPTRSWPPRSAIRGLPQADPPVSSGQPAVAHDDEGHTAGGTNQGTSLSMPQRADESAGQATRPLPAPPAATRPLPAPPAATRPLPAPPAAAAFSPVGEGGKRRSDGLPVGDGWPTSDGVSRGGREEIKKGKQRAVPSEAPSAINDNPPPAPSANEDHPPEAVKWLVQNDPGWRALHGEEWLETQKEGREWWNAYEELWAAEIDEDPDLILGSLVRVARRHAHQETDGDAHTRWIDELVMERLIGDERRQLDLPRFDTIRSWAGGVVADYQGALTAAEQVGVEQPPAAASHDPAPPRRRLPVPPALSISARPDISVPTRDAHLLQREAGDDSDASHEQLPVYTAVVEEPPQFTPRADLPQRTAAGDGAASSRGEVAQSDAVNPPTDSVLVQEVRDVVGQHRVFGNEALVQVVRDVVGQHRVFGNDLPANVIGLIQTAAGRVATEYEGSALPGWGDSDGGVGFTSRLVDRSLEVLAKKRLLNLVRQRLGREGLSGGELSGVIERIMRRVLVASGVDLTGPRLKEMRERGPSEFMVAVFTRRVRERVEVINEVSRVLGEDASWGDRLPADVHRIVENVVAGADDEQRGDLAGSSRRHRLPQKLADHLIAEVNGALAGGVGLRKRAGLPGGQSVDPELDLEVVNEVRTRLEDARDRGFGGLAVDADVDALIVGAFGALRDSRQWPEVSEKQRVANLDKRKDVVAGLAATVRARLEQKQHSAGVSGRGRPAPVSEASRPPEIDFDALRRRYESIEFGPERAYKKSLGGSYDDEFGFVAYLKDTEKRRESLNVLMDAVRERLRQEGLTDLRPPDIVSRVYTTSYEDLIVPRYWEFTRNGHSEFMVDVLAHRVRQYLARRPELVTAVRRQVLDELLRLGPLPRSEFIDLNEFIEHVVDDADRGPRDPVVAQLSRDPRVVPDSNDVSRITNAVRRRQRRAGAPPNADFSLAPVDLAVVNAVRYRLLELKDVTRPLSPAQVSLDLAPLRYITVLGKQLDFDRQSSDPGGQLPRNVDALIVDVIHTVRGNPPLSRANDVAVSAGYGELVADLADSARAMGEQQRARGNDQAGPSSGVSPDHRAKLSGGAAVSGHSQDLGGPVRAGFDAVNAERGSEPAPTPAGQAGESVGASRARIADLAVATTASIARADDDSDQSSAQRASQLAVTGTRGAAVAGPTRVSDDPVTSNQPSLGGASASVGDGFVASLDEDRAASVRAAVKKSRRAGIVGPGGALGDLLTPRPNYTEQELADHLATYVRTGSFSADRAGGAPRERGEDVSQQLLVSGETPSLIARVPLPGTSATIVPSKPIHGEAVDDSAGAAPSTRSRRQLPVPPAAPESGEHTEDRGVDSTAQVDPAQLATQPTPSPEPRSGALPASDSARAGDNGSRSTISSDLDAASQLSSGRLHDRAHAVGLERAPAVRDALRHEINRQLLEHPHLADVLTFSDATSRGRALPDGIVTTGDPKVDEAKRRVVVVRATDAVSFSTQGAGPSVLVTGPNAVAHVQPITSTIEGTATTQVTDTSSPRTGLTPDDTSGAGRVSSTDEGRANEALLIRVEYLDKAVWDPIEAQRRVDGAARELSEAQQRRDQAQEALNEATREQQKVQEQLRFMPDAVFEARQRSSAARQRLDEAERELGEAREQSNEAKRWRDQGQRWLDEASRGRREVAAGLVAGAGRVGAGVIRHPLGDARRAVETARMNAHWWGGLSDEQQQALIKTYPADVGNAEGIPPQARDRANRAVLQAERTRLGKRALWQLIDREKLARLDAIDAALNRDKSQTELVLAFDPDAFGGAGRIVVSVGGDPYEADQLVWYVYKHTGGSARRLGDVLGMARSASEDRVSIAWAGYGQLRGWRQDRTRSADQEYAIFEADKQALYAGQQAAAVGRDGGFTSDDVRREPDRNGSVPPFDQTPARQPNEPEALAPSAAGRRRIEIDKRVEIEFSYAEPASVEVASGREELDGVGTHDDPASGEDSGPGATVYRVEVGGADVDGLHKTLGDVLAEHSQQGASAVQASTAGAGGSKSVSDRSGLREGAMARPTAAPSSLNASKTTAAGARVVAPPPSLASGSPDPQAGAAKPTSPFRPDHSETVWSGDNGLPSRERSGSDSGDESADSHLDTDSASFGRSAQPAAGLPNSATGMQNPPGSGAHPDTAQSGTPLVTAGLSGRGLAAPPSVSAREGTAEQGVAGVQASAAPAAVRNPVLDGAGLRTNVDNLEDHLRAALAGVEDTGQDCVLRLDMIRAHFYGPDKPDFSRAFVPGSGARAVRDDSVLISGPRQEDALAGALGGHWQPVGHSLTTAIDKLKALGPGSTAFILTSPGTEARSRHGLGLRNEDGELLWIETQNKPGERVRPFADVPLVHTTDARVIVTDGSGNYVPLDENMSQPHSTINALIDPARNLYYRFGGLEIETGFEVDMPYEKACALANNTIVSSPYFKIVLDAKIDSAGKAKPIVEIVSWKGPMLDRERLPGRDHLATTYNVLKEMELALRRMKLARPGTTLREIFPEDEGYEFSKVKKERQYKVIKYVWTAKHSFKDLAIRGETFPGHLHTHYSAGVPIAAMYAFIQFAYQGTYSTGLGGLNRHLRSALLFSDHVACRFIGLPDGQASSSTLNRLVDHDLELAELQGHMAATYTQVAAYLHYKLARHANFIAKSYTPIAVRTHLNAMFNSLPEPVRIWLDQHSALIENLLEQRFAADNPKLMQLMPNGTRPGALLNKGSRSFTARDYFHNATKKQPRILINQQDALNVRTNFADLDHGLVVVELRYHGPERGPLPEIKRTYYQLQKTVQELDSKMQRNNELFGDRAAVLNGKLVLPSSEGTMLVDSQQTQIDGFASYVADQAARRNAIGRSGVVVHAQGGTLHDGAHTLSLQHAHTAVTAVRSAISSHLARRGVAQHAVTYGEPLSRDEGEETALSGDGTHDVVEFWIEPQPDSAGTIQGEEGNRPPAGESDDPAGLSFGTAPGSVDS